MESTTSGFHIELYHHISAFKSRPLSQDAVCFDNLNCLVLAQTSLPSAGETTKEVFKPRLTDMKSFAREYDFKSRRSTFDENEEMVQAMRPT